MITSLAPGTLSVWRCSGERSLFGKFHALVPVVADRRPHPDHHYYLADHWPRLSASSRSDSIGGTRDARRRGGAKAVGTIREKRRASHRRFFSPGVSGR